MTKNEIERFNKILDTGTPEEVLKALQWLMEETDNFLQKTNKIIDKWEKEDKQEAEIKNADK